MYYLDQTLHGIFLNWTASKLRGYYVTILIHSWCIQFGHIMAMEEVEDGRHVWCPCPLPRERMEDPPPRHRRHCHWSSVTSQQTLLSTGTMMILSLQSFAASSFCLQIRLSFLTCRVKPVSEALWSLCIAHSAATRVKSCCSAAGVQECKCRVLHMQHCSTRNYRDQEFIFSHSTRINWPSILGSKTKIRIPHIPASLNLIYLWPNGIRAEM